MHLLFFSSLLMLRSVANHFSLLFRRTAVEYIFILNSKQLRFVTGHVKSFNDKKGFGFIHPEFALQNEIIKRYGSWKDGEHNEKKLNFQCLYITLILMMKSNYCALLPRWILSVPLKNKVLLLIL